MRLCLFSHPGCSSVQRVTWDGATGHTQHPIGNSEISCLRSFAWSLPDTYP